MEAADPRSNKAGLMEGFSPVSPPRIFWNSRKRSANGRSLARAMEEESLRTQNSDKPEESTVVESKPPLSERRRALFEPLDPTTGNSNGQRTPAEILLPPPDFDPASYPTGWLVGKKRKLVNVDVVESMRRIAVQEMNRKDREIDGLNEQLEEDSRCLEHLQVQLLEERSKRAGVERENVMLQDQISLLMNMLNDIEPAEEDDAPPDS